MDSVSGSNPRPNEFLALPQKFKGGMTEYDDGGVDAALQHGGNGIRVWRLRYQINSLTNPSHAAILDSHFTSAKWLEGQRLSAETFNFRDRDSGVLYSGVRYTRYEVSRTKTWAQIREVELTKFP